MCMHACMQCITLHVSVCICIINYDTYAKYHWGSPNPYYHIIITHTYSVCTWNPESLPLTIILSNNLSK